MDVYRPSQQTPVPNLFLAGSYTFQDYIDSMEGATKSALLCADKILAATEALQGFKAPISELELGAEEQNQLGSDLSDRTIATTSAALEIDNLSTVA